MARAYYLSEYSRVFAMIFDWIIKLGNLTSDSNKVSKKMAVVSPSRLSTVQQKVVLALRTVPAEYKGFCARLGPFGKSRSLQGLLEYTKKTGGSHAFFEIISLDREETLTSALF